LAGGSPRPERFVQGSGAPTEGFREVVPFLVLASLLVAVAAWIAGNGSAIQQAASGSVGSVGGLDYDVEGPALVLLCVPVVLLGVGEWLRRRPLGGRSPRRRLLAAARVSLHAVPFLSRTFFLGFLAWVVLTDVFGLWHVTPGRLCQLVVDEASSGRLLQALTTTVLRNLIALAVGACLAIVVAILVQESRRFGSGLVPVLRLGALIPPLFLFTFAPWLGKAIDTAAVREWFAGHGVTPYSSVYRVFGYFDRTLVLASIAFWPLVISAVSGLSRVRDTLTTELDSLRLSRWRALCKVQLPLVIRYMSPAFYIAIVLVFVVCVEAESSPAVDRAVDGIAHYYLRTACDTGATDIWVLGLTTIICVGTCFLFVFDLVTAFFSGLSPNS
jgi:ABC-type nitrate/sulfonate/bicarbonate transport system permease component